MAATLATHGRIPHSRFGSHVAAHRKVISSEGISENSVSNRTSLPELSVPAGSGARAGLFRPAEDAADSAPPCRNLPFCATGGRAIVAAVAQRIGKVLLRDHAALIVMRVAVTLPVSEPRGSRVVRVPQVRRDSAATALARADVLLRNVVDLRGWRVRDSLAGNYSVPVQLSPVRHMPVKYRRGGAWHTRTRLWR